jgi:hypothetical protein
VTFTNIHNSFLPCWRANPSWTTGQPGRKSDFERIVFSLTPRFSAVQSGIQSANRFNGFFISTWPRHADEGWI